LINQKLILRVLSKLGYNAALANNGQEVLDKLNEAFFDLVFMDIQMPVMDGFEATKRIRSDFATQPKIVAMTANAMAEDRDACLAAGMDDYMSKPINLQELVLMLEKIALKAGVAT
jgi:CheY-like chemotaxis protein